jgi:hypothetical protein
MVSAINNSPQSSFFPRGGIGSVPALEGRIQQDQMQLNDWTTCVSAKTPKGQAAIQKLSGEISATKAQISRAQPTQSNAPADTPNAQFGLAGARTEGESHSVDVWA